MAHNRITITATILNQTDRAWLIYAAGALKRWIPKSQVRRLKDGRFSMTARYAYSKGLV